MKTPVSELLASLCPLMPDWATGMVGRGLMRRHLNQLLNVCQTPELTDLAHRVARWNWQVLPWDQHAIETCSRLTMHEENPSRSAWASNAIPQANPNFKVTMQAIATNQSELVTELWRGHGATSENIAWLGEACLFFMQHGDTAQAKEVLERANIPANHPVRLYLQALFSFHFGPPELAIPHIKALPEEWQELRSYLKAECLLRLGDKNGVKILEALWRKIPWHVNLTLKLHDLLTPEDVPTPPSEDTAVLIYSWNNAELLAKTLQSMADSNLDAATLIILDNGSSDHTPSVIKAFAKLFGARLKAMRLPVNIGAPAARNWLLQHPETSRFRTVVFVDDDVLLPPDWLTELATQYGQAPAGTIVGCRIMDQAPRQSVQTADVNLLGVDADGEFLIANTDGELDLGLYDYTRPCLSVTGCCHMMDRRHAEELGGFDLRFSPSQFDDFDLDLRNALHGGHAIFAGRTAIRHCQRSSLSQADSEAKQGHLFGNMKRHNTKFSPMHKAELLHLWAQGTQLQSLPYRTIQSIWRYFEEVGERKIRFTNNAPMNLDLGQYDGRRPCLSVMGCCHMIDRHKLERLGVPDFDVRFTPSQVDDLERDIQIWKHGGRVLYDGRVEVVHMQDAGRAAPKTEASWGHVWGNHMKMEFKFTGRELRDIDEKVRAVEEKHWQDCLAKAWDLLPDNCRKFWAEQNAR